MTIYYIDNIMKYKTKIYTNIYYGIGIGFNSNKIVQGKREYKIYDITILFVIFSWCVYTNNSKKRLSKRNL